MDNTEHGRSPLRGSGYSAEPGPISVVPAVPVSIPNAALQKSIYFDMTVRALEEMIANERKWVEQPVQTILAHVRSDTLYPYADNMAGDVYSRCIRLSVLGSILAMMTRNLRAASGMEARQGGDANAAPSSDDSPVPQADAPTGEPND